MTIQIQQQIDCDLLIIGSGIAGLAACVEAHEQGLKPLLATKTTLGSGASFFPLKATLGIQVTGGEADYAHFQADIERVAQGRNNPKIVRAYIEESAQAVELLDKIGFRAWKRNDNRPACFAQFPRPIYLINQWREAAERARTILENQQTPLLEHTTLIDLVVEDNQLQGAVLLQKTAGGENSYLFCRTPHLILASGGIAGLYQDNLYPADVIGSSHYLAKKAGANLVNLAFIQFIPSFIEPKYKVLFGEHTLKYVTKVTDAEGNNLFPHLSESEFKQMIKERSDYAPFSVDFACIEFDLVMMKYLQEHPEAKGVYLTYSPELYRDQEEFYRVYLDWLEKEVGINLCRDKVAIAPFAHSCNGGIEIDEFAQTAVKGLFAVGEVSSAIEGANRLGGNSVSGGLVFARRAVRQIQKIKAEDQQKNRDFSPPSTTLLIAQREAKLNALANPNADLNLTASQVLSQIRVQMAKFANVYRTPNELKNLWQFLLHLEAKYCPITHEKHQGIEIYNALKTAQEVVKAMLNEPKSLGAHYIAED